MNILRIKDWIRLIVEGSLLGQRESKYFILECTIAIELIYWGLST